MNVLTDLPGGRNGLASASVAASPRVATSHGPLGLAPPGVCPAVRLLTPQGLVAAGALQAGDMVIDADGATRTIHWIGDRSFAADAVPDDERAAILPIYISRGSIAANVPMADIAVSPACMLQVAGHATLARDIAQARPFSVGVAAVKTVRYLHIETDIPAMLLAEGLAVYSLLPRADRNRFANAANRPANAAETVAPLPVVVAVPVAEPAMAPAAPQPPAETVLSADGLTGDAGLHLIVDGVVIRRHMVADRVHRFTVPAKSQQVHIMSRCMVPHERDATEQDRRRLGVGLCHVVIRTETLEIELGHQEGSLIDGFHDREEGHRWTDGKALLPPRFYRWLTVDSTFEVHVLDTSLRYQVDSTPAAPAFVPPAAPPEVVLPNILLPPPQDASTVVTFTFNRPSRPRALVIDACTPTPDRDAGSNVTLWHMRLLQDIGYDVTFVPQDNFTAIPGYTDTLHARGIATIEIPRYSAMEPFLRDRGSRFALVYVHRYAVAEQCIPLLRRHAPQARILFNNADLHYLRLERAARLSGVAADTALAASVKTRELAVIAACDCTVLCNTVEEQMLRRELPAARLHVLPWVIEPRTDPAPPFDGREGFMFLGGFAHPPNIDAVQWFVASVLPILRRLLPQARLHVYGANIPAEIAALASEAVVIGGQVADLRAVFDRHRVAVAPLRFGAGFKGKLAEALAAGIPSVATPIAIEGTGLVEGQDVLVAEGAASFAMALARLTADRVLWERVARSGLAFVERTLTPASGRAHLEAILHSVGAEREATTS